METKRSKYILAGLTVLCVLLICITSLKDGIMEPLRTGVGYFLIPIQTGVNAVGTGIYNELKDYGSLKDALRENEELKTQIVQLTEDNNRLQAEQFELDRLRKLYELDQNYMQYDKIGARVIARDSEKWFQVFRINKGSADGVAVDMNVGCRRRPGGHCDGCGRQLRHGAFHHRRFQPGGSHEAGFLL